MNDDEGSCQPWVDSSKKKALKDILKSTIETHIAK